MHCLVFFLQKEKCLITGLIYIYQEKKKEIIAILILVEELFLSCSFFCKAIQHKY